MFIPFKNQILTTNANLKFTSTKSNLTKKFMKLYYTYLPHRPGCPCSCSRSGKFRKQSAIAFHRVRMKFL